MLVVVISVQVMVIDVAVCMVALRSLGGSGTASVKHYSILYNIIIIIVWYVLMVLLSVEYVE